MNQICWRNHSNTPAVPVRRFWWSCIQIKLGCDRTVQWTQGIEIRDHFNHSLISYSLQLCSFWWDLINLFTFKAINEKDGCLVSYVHIHVATSLILYEFPMNKITPIILNLHLKFQQTEIPFSNKIHMKRCVFSCGSWCSKR